METLSLTFSVFPLWPLHMILCLLFFQIIGNYLIFLDHWQELPVEEEMSQGTMPGASVRNSVRGKGHEEGGSTYTKAVSSLRSPPGNSQASTPKTRVCLLSALTYISDFTGGCPPLPLSEKRVNLQLQLIKFLGVIVFQPTNSFGSPLACLNWFFQPHVIAQSLPTVRGMRCSKLSKHRFL